MPDHVMWSKGDNITSPGRASSKHDAAFAENKQKQSFFKPATHREKTVCSILKSMDNIDPKFNLANILQHVGNQGNVQLMKFFNE